MHSTDAQLSRFDVRGYPLASASDLRELDSEKTGFVEIGEVFKAWFGPDLYAAFPGMLEIRPARICEVKVERNRTWGYNRTLNEEGAPVFVQIRYTNWQTHRTGMSGVSQDAFSPIARTLAENATDVGLIHTHSQNSHYFNTGHGSLNVAVTCTYQDKPLTFALSADVAEVWLGMEITEDFTIRLRNGLERKISDWKSHFDRKAKVYNSRRGDYDYRPFDFTFDTINQIVSDFPMNTANLERVLKGLVKGNYKEADIEMSGISKVYKKLLPFAEKVKMTDPAAYCAFRSLAGESKRSIDSVKVSVVFNDLFGGVETEEDFLTTLKSFWLKCDTQDNRDEGSYYYHHRRFYIEDAIKRVPVWKEKRKAAIKSTATRAFGKLMQEYEFLNLDEERFPVTTAAIKDGDIPISTFFRKSEQYFLLNDNWELWEGMLTAHKDVTVEIAKEASKRTTYEKDIMSYFYFILHGLPDYLKKHTGKKWKCVPRLVESASELEPPKADDDSGITRSRSALTPIVDNDNRTVTVPYASLAIGGSYGTTYCYSHDYHVLQRGFSFNGNAVNADLEEKLNGRDDYGLMFYTLTGSAQGRGYPTFLIIFERRTQKGDTKVHFHRTHPSRSKGGDYNAIHNWTKVCYNWMAGNVRRDLIKAQQGDLFFVDVAESEKNLDFKAQVNAYDSHAFEYGVEFAEYSKAAKSNILGYVRLKSESWLRHPEHDDVLIPAGTYAIHQCRSWEANPQGVWSLRID